MDGISGLLYLKQIAVFNQKNEDSVVSLEGVDDELLFGTLKGKIIRFRLKDDKLVYCDSLFLSANPITHLKALPGTDLLLSVHNKLLFPIIHSTLTHLEPCDHGSLDLLSINPRTKNSNVFLLAQTTNRKQILICKGALTDQGLHVEVIERIATSANVTCICFDGKSICYSTQVKYYVLDLTSQARTHHELITLDDSVSPHIVSVGQDEFAICGSDGLIVFVNSDGTSFRPPLDLGIKVENMLFRRPTLYVIGPTSLTAYNILDKSVKVTLPRHSLQLLGITSGRLVALSQEKKVFQLELVESFAEKIRHALRQNVDDGLQLLQGVRSIFPVDKSIVSTCNSILFDRSIECLNDGDSKLGLDLLLQTDFDPATVLLRIAKLNEPSEPKLWDIDLETTQGFLESLLSDNKFSTSERIVQSYLIRTRILLNSLDFNEIDEPSLGDVDLKQWLLANNFHVMLAELYFKYGRFREAFEVWKEYGNCTQLDQTNIEPFTNKLPAVIDVGDMELLNEILAWLTLKMPELSIEIAQKMPFVDLDSLSNMFNAYPHLLLEYLENRAANEHNSEQLNVKLSKTYAKVLHVDSNDWKARQSFRNFLTSIPYSDDVLATVSENQEFETERLLYTTMPETVEKALQQLTNKDLEAAEILYIKYSNEQPHLIKFLIPKYLEEEDDQKMQKRLLQLLCQIQPFAGIEQLIADLPSSCLTPKIISLFQSTFEEYNQSRSNTCLRLAIDKLIKNSKLENQIQRECTSVRYDTTDLCNLCKSQLKNENISFLHNKVVHSRCLRKL